jgi:DNA polymerase-3 subunit delta'
VPIVPLYGHATLRRRLRDSVARGTLPGSLLIQGPRGIGKQRLALWLGQLLLCTAEPEARPCGECTSCRYATTLVHPDLRWFFPRPRLADADASAQQVLDDYADALTARAAASGLYAAPSGSEAIFVATVRAISGLASYTPTFGARKVFVVGDAERMVPQEGADAAANAFLKLLEEPPADTTLILTTSEPGALLPTIRSRVVSLRAAPLPESDVRAFLDDAAVAAALDAGDAPPSTQARVQIAAGAPGKLLSAASQSDALAVARALLAAASAEHAERLRATFALGGSKSRGFFSDVLDALTLLLHERARAAAVKRDARAAVAAARAIRTVEDAKMHAGGNVSPQLLGAALLRDLGASAP